MTLRARLLLAQVPLALALVIVGVVSAVVTTQLGERARLILADNYRSVLAAQRMKESLERIDSFSVLVTLGRTARAETDMARHQTIFATELAVQEGNITEAGEIAVTRGLRAAWVDYQQALDRFQRRPPEQNAADMYFATLEPRFNRVKAAAEEILAINQDAMVRKSDRAVERAQAFERVVMAAVVLALLLGLLASTWLTARWLRPLGIVHAAIRRFGEGDLVARASVPGRDEIAAVAAAFNGLAETLQRYRASTLGELLQGQQEAQAAIDSLPDPVLLLDANGAVRGANSAASTFLGVDTERSAERAFDGVDPQLRVLVDRLRGHVLAGRGGYVPRGFEDAVRVTSAVEGERVFLPRATPTYGENGAVTGAAIVLQDATRLFRFDELKNDLVATVAHEFRTPLTSLRMALHLCTEQVVGPLTAKQADLLFAAREDCERLQTIVDELLNLARIDGGHIDLQRRRAVPEALVDAAVDVHAAAAKQAGVDIRKEVSPGLPEVFVDPDRLQLVFTNLLVNAIRYAPPGSAIVLRAHPAAAPAGSRPGAMSNQVRFEIVDRGAGIAPQHQAGLFDKFFRVPGSPEGGSGLGLFIAKGLVQAHGGTIGVDSDEGRGTTFWFTVPVAGGASESGGER
ncbi:MAG: ATP-binding protein [Pseudomonadota bacterium]